MQSAPQPEEEEPQGPNEQEPGAAAAETRSGPTTMSIILMAIAGSLLIACCVCTAMCCRCAPAPFHKLCTRSFLKPAYVTIRAILSFLCARLHSTHLPTASLFSYCRRNSKRREDNRTIAHLRGKYSARAAPPTNQKKIRAKDRAAKRLAKRDRDETWQWQGAESKKRGSQSEFMMAV